VIFLLKTWLVTGGAGFIGSNFSYVDLPLAVERPSIKATYCSGG
jgi:dTDP-D-glucose 4,6-dehydratase